MLRLILTITLLSGFLFCEILSAQEQPIKKRAARQHHKIEQDVKSGQLTKEEALQLKEEQSNIKIMKEKAKADGVVTKAEKQQIRAAKKAVNK